MAPNDDRWIDRIADVDLHDPVERGGEQDGLLTAPADVPRVHCGRERRVVHHGDLPGSGMDVLRTEEEGRQRKAPKAVRSERSGGQDQASSCILVIRFVARDRQGAGAVNLQKQAEVRDPIL